MNSSDNGASCVGMAHESVVSSASKVGTAAADVVCTGVNVCVHCYWLKDIKYCSVYNCMLTAWHKVMLILEFICNW